MNEPEDFELTIYSYSDWGGKHQHNNFALTVDKAIKVAEKLYQFATNGKKRKQSHLLTLEQEYKSRGKLFIKASNELVLSIGSYESSDGTLTLTKKQAKKVAGYLFFWAGEKLIGTRKVKVPAKTSFVLDINDIYNK